MYSKFVVLGGGLGGYVVVFLVVDEGMEVMIVEVEGCMGGICLLCGCILFKVFFYVV